MKRCVICLEDTVERQHEDVTLDACPNGHGVWLLERELVDAVHTVADGSRTGMTYEEGRSLTMVMDHDVKVDDEVRDCPMCERPMNSVEYAFTSGVVIDACPTHGVWLDAGELDQLEQAAEQRADPSSPESLDAEARRAARDEAGNRQVELKLSIVDSLRGMFFKR